MMTKTNGELPSNRVQAYLPWLDVETLAEIMPEPVVLASAGCTQLRETTITFVKNESTDDI